MQNETLPITETIYQIVGNEIYPMSCSYTVGMKKYTNPYLYSTKYIGTTTHSFNFSIGSNFGTIGPEAFLYINGQNGAEVSIIGFVDTWAS